MRMIDKFSLSSSDIVPSGYVCKFWETCSSRGYCPHRAIHLEPFGYCTTDDCEHEEGSRCCRTDEVFQNNNDYAHYLAVIGDCNSESTQCLDDEVEYDDENYDYEDDEEDDDISLDTTYLEEYRR